MAATGPCFSTTDCKLPAAILLFVISLLYVNNCQMVIMPTHPSTVHNSWLSDARISPNLTESEPQDFTLTISEGGSIDVQVNSKSLSFKLCLSRPVMNETLKVNVTALSVSSIIYFDNEEKDQSVIVEFEEREFGEKQVSFSTRDIAGHAEIVAKVVKQPKEAKIDDSKAYISIDVAKSLRISIMIATVGWIYFLAWSISFYFQVILNYSRRSVIGLNFDFLALNLVGFTAYSIYNLSFLFSRQVQQDYLSRNSYHRIPVEYNDLFFSLHALLITIVTISQCFYYERGDQNISIFASVFISASLLVSALLYACYLFNWAPILYVVLFISYVKLAITLIKYVPQAWMNRKNKSTDGWSIHNIILDFTGGLFSLLQMFLISYNYDDWISILGNLTKFGLGLFSISFDILFFIQHFILYKNNSNNNSQANESASYDNEAAQNSSDEEEERQRRIQASSGAIQSSHHNVCVNEDLIG